MGPDVPWWGAEQQLASQPHPNHVARMAGLPGSVPLAMFRGGRGGAPGAAGWLGAGPPLRTAPYVSFCTMLGAKPLCLSLAADAALEPSW